MLDLGSLHNGIDRSDALAVNNSGDVVGSSFSAIGERAVLWKSSGGIEDLGDLREHRPTPRPMFIELTTSMIPVKSSASAM